MDSSEPTKVPLDPDGRVQGDTSGDTSDSPDCLLVHPTRQALDYLEQALTTGIPKPNYDGPIARPIMASGKHPIDMVWTLPLESPFHIAQSTSPLHLMWDCVNLNPEPDLETCPPSELMKPPTNDTRDAQASASQARDNLAKTTNPQSPPRGIFSRPKLRGILRNGVSDQNQAVSKDSEAQGKASANATSRAKPSGRRRTAKFQLPQSEAESAPEAMQARSRGMVTIKSHAAARKWEELENREK